MIGQIMQVGLPLLPILEGDMRTVSEFEDLGTSICVCSDLEHRLFDASCAALMLDTASLGPDTAGRFASASFTVLVSAATCWLCLYNTWLCQYAVPNVSVMGIAFSCVLQPVCLLPLSGYIGEAVRFAF